MELKKVLIFTGKFPNSGEDIDGGSILINTLINTLKNNCLLDVVFTRTFRKEFEKIDGIRNVSFETYKYHIEDKFARRLANKEQLFSFLEKNIKNYDKVIITHCSKAFGVEKLSTEDLEKIILFPMYLSPSYQRGGEYPNDIYINNEKLSLQYVGKILTPSESERKDMLNVFEVDKEKIKVIPRGYSGLIKQIPRTIGNIVELLYIASIKQQKNTMEALVILNSLLKKSYNVRLNLVGSFQDNNLMIECQNYIKNNNLNNRVRFYGTVKQCELAKIISLCDINMSVSNWETFGRGVFEGMAGGLPTIIYDRLECVKQYLEDNKGIFFVSNQTQFIDVIAKLINNPDFYNKQSIEAINSVKDLSEDAEKYKLLKEIL